MHLKYYTPFQKTPLNVDTLLLIGSPKITPHWAAHTHIGILRGYSFVRGVWGGGGEDHASLKIKQSFHVLSSSSSFTTFCMMSTKSQFTTIKPHGYRLTGNNLWQMTAHGCLANHVSQERKQPFCVSRQLNIAIRGSRKYLILPSFVYLSS